MRRWDFIAKLGSAAAWPLGVQAQQNVSPRGHSMQEEDREAT
jgi:hypothetical protein